MTDSPGLLAPWQLTLVVMVGSLVLVEVVYGAVKLVLRGAKAPQLKSLLARSKHAARALAVSVAGTQMAALAPSHLRGGLEELTRVAVIFSAAWIAIGVSGLLVDLAEGRFDVGVPDNRLARRAVTQLNLLRRVAIVVIVVLGVLTALTSLPQARSVGASLLGAAGVVGIVAGIAGQSTLGNIVAGLQIAFSDSLRIDDVVVVENEWGTIEEITLTYVVVKIWDQRRLVLPVSYFVKTPFQNWTRRSAQILGTVMLYVDYEVAVDALRKEFESYVAGHPLWDGQVAVLQVVEATPMALQLRLLMSSATSSRSWDLRCAVREHMVGYVQQSFPQSLPRARLAVSDGHAREPVHRQPTLW